MYERLKGGPTALYGQLASIMRSQILAGRWGPETKLPTIRELCERYLVSRITVRQAIQILADEGLLISGGRGKRVMVAPQRAGSIGHGFQSTIDSIVSNEADHEIVLLKRVDGVALPPDAFFFGAPAPSYTSFKKVHKADGIPYGAMTIYVAQTIVDQFPPGIEGREELAPLLTTYAKPPVASGRERIMVAAADYDEAQLLEYPMAAPVATIVRIMCNTKGVAIYVGQFTYRGDRFGIEREPAAYVKRSWSGLRTFDSIREGVVKPTWRPLPDADIRPQ